VNALLALPLPVRLAGLFVVGLLAGQLVNWGIYALAWKRRQISPWQPPLAEAPPRKWHDFLPVVGWLGLAREAPLHGSGFWVRPPLLELACGAGLAWLYWWEVTLHLAQPVVGVVPLAPAAIHQAFASHALLFWLMLVATFIDFDEKTIPDEITIPGTLLALVLAIGWPQSHLPVVTLIGPVGLAAYRGLLLTSTGAWPAWLDGGRGLGMGVAIFVAWCLALIPALATTRRGWRKAFAFYIASIRRGSAWWQMLALAAIGSAAIIAGWYRGGESWRALLTSLVGLSAGGGLVWAVRIVGWAALRKEAMGFGDVTLMAMIGAFLGWQASLIVFFLSPCAALVIAVTQWLLTGRRDIAFGPYLCLSAAFVVVAWPHVWEQVFAVFQMGWLVPIALAACLLLMMGLLMAWRLIEQALFGGEKYE
jgi:leader peptidase (prepilin peptidase) / N-methyltransferase